MACLISGIGVALVRQRLPGLNGVFLSPASSLYVSFLAFLITMGDFLHSAVASS